MQKEIFMKTVKKIIFTGLVVTCFVFSGAASAGQQGQAAPDERSKTADSASLTDAQKAAVKSVLAKYNAATLTAADAKAIHGAFRDACLRGGPGLNEAVKSAGFDSDKLRDLDPPPDMQGRGEGGSKESQQGRKGTEQSPKQDK